MLKLPTTQKVESKQYDAPPNAFGEYQPKQFHNKGMKESSKARQVQTLNNDINFKLEDN